MTKLCPILKKMCIKEECQWYLKEKYDKQRSEIVYKCAFILLSERIIEKRKNDNQIQN